MNKILKSVIIAISLLFLNLLIIWIVTFILNKNEINGMPILTAAFAGIYLLISYFFYGIVLAILNRFVYHSKTVSFLVFFYISISIYIIIILNTFGLLPFIKQLPWFDSQNFIIELHNTENDPLGIIVLMPLNLAMLISSTTVSYISTSFIFNQMKKAMKELNT